MAAKKRAVEAAPVEEEPKRMDMKDRAVLILMARAFPHCGAHFAWEKCQELAGADVEAGEYLSALASLHEQQHTLTAHQ